MDMNAVLRRVQKLLAIAQDGRGDPNEAAAAAQQAENLMRKFNIEHSDLLTQRIERMEQEWATADVSPNMKRDDPSRPPLRRVPPWAGWLGFRCAKLNDCELRYAHTPAGVVVRFYGTKEDVQVAAWMFDCIAGQMISAARAWQRRAPRTKADSDSYRKGFILSVCKRLKELADERLREYASAGSALVVVKSDAIARHFGAFNYGAARKSAVSEQGAFLAGRLDGERADIHRRGVGHSASTTEALSA